MMIIKQCNRKNFCIECDHPTCLLKGKLISDCPKYRCDRKGELFEDCESCDFLKQFKKEMREGEADG